MNNIDIQYKSITAVLSKELAVYETIIDLFRQKLLKYLLKSQQTVGGFLIQKQKVKITLKTFAV